jgi:hypothetical protein
MRLLPSVTIQPNLELKTQPKQLLGSLTLVIALPGTVIAPNMFHLQNIKSIYFFRKNEKF